MNNLVLIKSSKGHIVLNIDNISVIGSAEYTDNKISLIITLSSGKSISLCTFASKDYRFIMNRIIEKLYYQILYRDLDEIINMDDIVNEAKKEENENKTTIS